MQQQLLKWAPCLAVHALLPAAAESAECCCHQRNFFDTSCHITKAADAVAHLLHHV
jgi:hypothetical protein